MLKQKWFCEICKVRGEVKYSKENADAMMVYYLIEDAHQVGSPACLNPTDRLRVVNEPLMTEADWEQFNSMTSVAGLSN